MSLHCVFDIQNLVLCLTCELLKSLDYKTIPNYIIRLHLILPLLANISSKLNKN